MLIEISLFEVVFPFLVKFFELASVIVGVLSIRIVVVSRCLLVPSCCLISRSVLNLRHLTIPAAQWLLLQALQICVYLALDLAVPSL